MLAFNSLANQSDQDEQCGFMMLFSGAVAELRKSRAHGFIWDDPERALDFIALVILLAKLSGRCFGTLEPPPCAVFTGRAVQVWTARTPEAVSEGIHHMGMTDRRLS